MRQDRAVSFVNNPGLALGEISLVRIKRLAREFLWVGLGQAAAALGGLAGVSLLTRALAPELYGELALGMTVATLTQQAVLGPVSGALIRFFAPAVEAGQLNAYLKGARYLVTWATFVVLGLGAVLALVLSTTGQVNSIGLMITAFLFSLLSGYSSAMDGVQNAARQRAVVAWHQGIGQWLRFLVALAMIGTLGAFSQAAMLGYAVASAMVLASQTFFFRRKILVLLPASSANESNPVERWTRQMRAYAWPFALWGVFTWAQMASDRWALQVCGSVSAVGLSGATGFACAVQPRRRRNGPGAHGAKLSAERLDLPGIPCAHGARRGGGAAFSPANLFAVRRAGVSPRFAFADLDDSGGRPVCCRADCRVVAVERREQPGAARAENCHGFARSVVEFCRRILAGAERRCLRRRRCFCRLPCLGLDTGEGAAEDPGV